MNKSSVKAEADELGGVAGVGDTAILWFVLVGITGCGMDSVAMTWGADFDSIQAICLVRVAGAANRIGGGPTSGR